MEALTPEALMTYTFAQGFQFRNRELNKVL
jgi:hypothetical protein